MRRERLREVRRALLLLALEEELEVGRQRDLGGGEGIERRQHRDDRTLVVARGARVDPRLVGQRIARVGPGDGGRAVFHPPAAQHRLEGRRLPVRLRADGLAVKVRIEKECPLRARRLALAVDRNRRTRRLEDARGDAALLQHRDEKRRVRPHVGVARRDVGMRQQLAQFADDVLLVGRDMGLGRRQGRRFVGADRHGGQREAGQHPGCYSSADDLRGGRPSANRIMAIACA